MALIVLVNGIEDVTQSDADRNETRKHVFQRQFPDASVEIFDSLSKTGDFLGDESIHLKAKAIVHRLQLFQATESTENVHSKPIVFVAHNMGAALVKKVLLIALESKAHQWMAFRTVALCFIESPSASDSSDWERFLFQLLAMKRLALSNISTLVHVLPKALAYIEKQFSVVSHAFNIYNEGPFQLGNDDPWNFQNDESKLSDVFLYVRTILRKTATCLHVEYQDFMQLLSSPDFSINRLNIADSYPKPLEWITEDPLYQSWQGMAQSSILELTGPSGCGKAYVASYILHSLHLRNPGSQALFLSFDFSSCGDQRDSERSLVSSLSRQILILKPDLYRSAKHLVRESPLLCKDLWALFQYLLSTSAYPRIFLVLNAVDRCRGDLMKELRRLVTTTSAMPPLKILITSAQSSTIKNETKILSMPLKVAVWDKAIRMIATERISTIIENRLVWKHRKQEIIEKLCYTDSTYISVMMNLDILERNHTVTTLSALKTLLDTPVLSAEMAFESMIGNIRSSELAKQALNWLFYAVRPLSVSELAVALALTQNRSPSDNNLAGELTFKVLIDNVSWDIMKELGSILGATIKIVDERIMLIHDEFRDYLEHKSGILIPKFNATITEQCLNYLLIYPKYKAKVSIDIDRLEIPHIGVAAAFIEYASLHWIDHYKREFPSKPVSDEKAQPTSYKKADDASDKKAEPTSDENAENVSDEKAEPTSDEKAKAITDEKVISFLETEEASQAWFEICASALRWKQGFPKHVFLQAIQLQLDQLVQHLLAKALSANIQDCIDGGAKISAETGNTTTLESLLDKTGSVDLRQLLEAAARGGHVDTINLIIARMDADTLETSKSDKSSKAPVLLSVMSGNTSAVRTLLDLKFSIQVSDEDHNTPAHIACQSGDVEMLKVMRELHESEFDLFMTRQNNQALCPLQLACQAGSVEAFDFVLEHSPIDKIKQSSEGSTNPIQLAAVSGHYKIVKKLLKAGAERSTGREGHTPLELAVAEGHYDVVHVLLREFNTQDEDLTEEILQTGRKDEKLIPKSILEECLDKAIIDGHSEIVRLLVKKTQRDSYSDKWRMRDAINSGHLDVVRVLAEEGISPIEWPEIYNLHSNIYNPLLDIAIRENFVDIVHYLVEEGLAPQDDGSETSIHYAAHLGHEYCIREMLRKMIATEVTDAIQRSDCNSMTAFERAAANGNFLAFKELLMWQNRAAGPDKSPPPRILILAIQSPNDKHTKVKFIEFLIDNHWEVNIAGTSEQQIPLHAAINQQHQEVVKLLLKRRASLDAVNHFKETCLHVALKLNTSAAKDMIEILLENGANPDLSDSEGRTALHYIAARPLVFGSKDGRCIVNSLIDHNADVNALTKDRMTPLYTSIEYANENMASYLLEEGKASPNIYGTLHSPLPLAVSRGYKDLVIRLLKVKADLDAIGGSFGSGLHAAAWTGATDIVNLLLENHASVDLEAPPFGKPLHVLAFTPQASALEFEQIATNLHAYKASINAYDYNQCTPLILAISRGKEFEAQTLIALGADAGVLDGSKSTALHHAAQLGLKSCVIALVEAGAEVDIRDGCGRSVLQRAILGFDSESESDASVFELLLEKLPVDKRKVNLEDALSASLKIDSREIFNTIIGEDDINLNIPDKSGWTSLDVAHCYELPDVIHMLENKGAKRGQQKEPTEWCSWDRANLVKLSPDKMEAWIEGFGHENFDIEVAGGVRSNHCIPTNSGLFYFEVDVLSCGRSSIIAIGLLPEHGTLDSLIGWEPRSWGYHSDDGSVLKNNEILQTYPKYGVNQTIGVGFKPTEKIAWFTLDGVRFGDMIANVTGQLYPAVSFQNDNEIPTKVRVNFGKNDNQPLKYLPNGGRRFPRK